MKNIFKKITIAIPLIVIFIGVFAMSCIFVNIYNKKSLNSQLQNKELSNNSSSVINATAQNNTVNSGNKISTTMLSKVADVSINLYYYGVGAKGLTPFQVSTLTKVSSQNAFPFTVTISPVLQVWYFAYPASLPPLTSIKDLNGFELIPDFMVTMGNMPDSSGREVIYRIYEYNNVTTLSSYKVTYK